MIMSFLLSKLHILSAWELAMKTFKNFFIFNIRIPLICVWILETELCMYRMVLVRLPRLIPRHNLKMLENHQNPINIKPIPPTCVTRYDQHLSYKFNNYPVIITPSVEFCSYKIILIIRIIQSASELKK
jgi:hypothetical protein